MLLFLLCLSLFAQAELFAQHDIAREQAKATLSHHPLRVSGQPLLATDMKDVVRV
jgi:hypothetical protein